MKRKDNGLKTIILVVTSLFLLGIACVGVYWKRIYDKLTEQPVTGIQIEETPSMIEDVRPVGKLYVCSSLIDDFVTERKEESALLGLVKKEHTAIQMLTVKCSYVIDLDKVKYNADNENKVVYVTMPELTYAASVKKTRFDSDDPVYWAKYKPDTNDMKEKVLDKIKKNFDTPQNREKASCYAEEAVSVVLEKVLGSKEYKVEFVHTIVQRRE